jgi:hypothetical protein
MMKKKKEYNENYMKKLLEENELIKNTSWINKKFNSLNKIV